MDTIHLQTQSSPDLLPKFRSIVITSAANRIYSPSPPQFGPSRPPRAISDCSDDKAAAVSLCMIARVQMAAMAASVVIYMAFSNPKKNRVAGYLAIHLLSEV